MDQHPDIEALLTEQISQDVEEHLKECLLCKSIVEDAQALEISLAGLNDEMSISVDREKAISKMISDESVRIRTVLFRKKVVTRVTAIAAALLISGILFLQILKNPPMTADLNGDGRVNVIDSFLLAKDLSQDKRIDLDLNKDGVTDDKDLQLLRQKVVSLGGEK